MNVHIEGKRPHGHPVRGLFRWLTFLGLCSAGIGAIIGFVAYLTLSQGLPKFQSLSDYRPKVVSRVYSQSGQLIGEFYRERRVFVPYEAIPPRMVQALLASEDDRFFDHGGIDYLGILRAAFANLKAGRVVQGGSTITQQVAKALLVTASGYKEGTKKKLSRKIKEAILARRLERTLSKAEILTLYLNHVFLGNHSYGIQVAAENYFRKNIRDLNLAEIALLAGLPQAPSRYSPFRYPERARKRRIYVLKRMLKEGFISAEDLKEAEQTAITVYDATNTSREVTPFFTEHVRRKLVAMYGEDAVLDEGLQVWTTVDVERYRAAEDAVYDKLRMVDKRQGFRGPLLQLTTKAMKKDFFDRYDKELLRQGRLEKLEEGEMYLGVVEKIDRKTHNVTLRVGPQKAILPLSAMRWARKVNPQAWFESNLLKKVPTSFKLGDVLHVRATTRKAIRKDRFATPFLKLLPSDKTVQLVALEQEPNLEAALLSLDIKSGYVHAMIGGYSFDRSEFNRAFQACRQPGSSFKPIVYSAALALNDWTASTIIEDKPFVLNDPKSKLRWKPKNFEGKFLGEVTLRTALQNSMNVPAIKVLTAVGIGPAVVWAKKLGITSKLPEEPGLALGSGCVTMADLADVYRLFGGGGRRTNRKFITRVVDRDGNVLFEDPWYRDAWIDVSRKVERALAHAEKPPERIIDARTAFLTTRLMRNVVLGGTGTPAQRLGVPVAGKTGTTNDSFDAWFMGFTSEIVTAAWVGYDDYVLPMGRYEQGGRAALPIWLAYMQRALKGKKTGEFRPPAGIVKIRIDPKTGKRARPDTIGAVSEYYKEGSEPKEYVLEAGAARLDEFGMEDSL